MNPQLQLLMMLYGCFANMPHHHQTKARAYGYRETNQQGRTFVRGARTRPEALEQVERDMKRRGHDVRKDGWNKRSRREIKTQGYAKKTYDKYLNNSYSDFRGSERKLPPAAIPWLRVWCCQHVEATQKEIQAALVIEFSVFISLSSVRNYLTLAGITRQRIRRIAAQRFTQENLDYANYFMNKINDYTHICWFDESGISQRGMQSRNNVGLGIRGSGGAYIREALRYPPKNLSVLGLIDKNGMFAVESFDGGTDTIRVDQYFQRHAVMMQARGVDCVVIDNCPSHRIASIAFWLQLVGIEVLFLPRYWPQWNPIEVRLVVLLLCCCCVVVVW